jgi:hypothetical protein
LLPEKHQSRDAAEREKYKNFKIKIRKGPSFLCFSTRILDFRDFILFYFIFGA